MVDKVQKIFARKHGQVCRGYGTVSILAILNMHFVKKQE